MKKIIVLVLLAGFFVCSPAFASQLGQPAPNFKAIDWKGKQVELQQFHGKQNVLLVFSRYIACAWCQMFIINLSKKSKEIAATDTEVLIVTNSAPEVVKAYKPPKDFSFNLIPDTDQKLYQIYGVKMEDQKMTGNVFWQTVRFVKYLGSYDYVKGGLEGSHYQPPACFVIGKDGKIKWEHLGKDVADNPSVDEILAELKK